MHDLPLVALLGAALAVTAVARRFGASPPLVLVLVGLAASFVPGIPDYEIEPELILLLVLPPLLYSAALDSSYLRIRENLRPIALLAVGLVLCTTATVGLAAWWLLPDLPLVSALVLGAGVAPPDAVAPTAVGRRLGLPRQVMTILGGESLVNDATALTVYRVAVAVAVGAGYSVWQGLGVFALAAAGGAAVGCALGWLVHRVRLSLRDGALESAVGLLVPFAAYLLAEEVGASGVIAVVVSGLYLGHRASHAGPAVRLQDQAVWKAADTLLESLVFALIGLQLRGVVEGIDTGLGSLLLIGIALMLVAVLTRVAWVFPTAYLPRSLSGGCVPASPRHRGGTRQSSHGLACEVWSRSLRLSPSHCPRNPVAARDAGSRARRLHPAPRPAPYRRRGLPAHSARTRPRRVDAAARVTSGGEPASGLRSDPGGSSVSTSNLPPRLVTPARHGNV